METIGKVLYNQWVKAWNEDLSIVEEIASSDCLVHQARTDGKSSLEKRGPEALMSIISDGLALFDEAKMSIEVGPIEEKAYVTARWKFSGKFKGGMSEAKAKPGKEMTFHGIDMFLIENEKIKEYWVSSDGLSLMEQMELF